MSMFGFAPKPLSMCGMSCFDFGMSRLVDVAEDEF